MNKIVSLRRTAEKAQEHGVFNMDIHSGTLLSLLDEMEAADALNKHLELAIRKAEGCSEKLRAGVEAAEKRNAELDNQLDTEIRTWTKKCVNAEARIAELEARTLTVKLPKPHTHLIWIQSGHPPDDFWDDVAVSHSEKDRCCDGSERYAVYAQWEIEEMLSAAGIALDAGE